MGKRDKIIMDITSTFLLYIIIDGIALFFMSVANSYKVRIGNAIVTNSCSWSKIRFSTIFMFFSFLCLYCLMLFRDYVGTDYSAYVNSYYSIGLNNLYEGEKAWLMQSPSFFVLCKFLYFFTDNYVVMFAVVGFITLFFFYKSIHDISINWWLSLYLFLCFCLYYQAFNQIRQMMAIAIISYSYRYLIEDDFKKFLIAIIIAASFHLSAVIFFVAWFVRKRRMNLKHLTIYIAIGVVLFLFFSKIQDVFSFLGYVQTYAADKNFSESFGLSTVLNFGVRLLMFVFCLLFYKETVKRAPYAVVYYNIAALCTVLQVGAMMFNIFGRGTTYFYLAYLFLIPEVLKTISDHFDSLGKWLVYTMTIIFFAIYFVVYYFSPAGAEGAGYILYSTWL